MASKIWNGSVSGDWSVSGNWTPSGVPATGDDVYLDGTVSVVDITAGLAQSAVTLASLTINDTFTGSVGTSAAYLAIGATTVVLGLTAQGRTIGQNSGRIKLNFGSVQTDVTVYSTSQTQTDPGLDPVRLLGTHASNALTVLSGRVGIATTTLIETSTFATISLTGSESYVTAGKGVTLTTVSNNGGTVLINSAVTTLNCFAGTTTARGTGLIGTLNANGGNINLFNRASGTDVTTLNFNGAAITTKGQPASVTIGTTNVLKGGNLSVFSATQVSFGTVTIDPTNITTLSVMLD